MAALCLDFKFTIRLHSVIMRNAALLHTETLKVVKTPYVLATEKKINLFYDLLHNYGFNDYQIKQILHSPAAVVGCCSQKELSSNLVGWLTFQMSHKLLSTFATHPELLKKNSLFIQQRFKQLMTLFARKDINKLLVTCPKVFLDDFDTVQEKMVYLVHFMGAEHKSIVKTLALQFDLIHIKSRHQFLKRCGVYIVKKSGSRNPALDKVFGRNMETFLKLTGLTEEEYYAFCDAFAAEEDYLLDCRESDMGSDNEESDDEDE